MFQPINRNYLIAAIELDEAIMDLHRARKRAPETPEITRLKSLIDARIDYATKMLEEVKRYG